MKLLELAAQLDQNFPTRRDEMWKYTDLSTIREMEFVPSRASSLPPSLDEHLLPWAYNLVLVDGFLISPMNCPVPIEEAQRPRLSPHFETDFFTEVNLRQGSPTVCIDLAKSELRPLHLIIVSQQANSLSAPRIQVRLGARQSAKILETHLCLGAERGLSVPLVEIQVGESANLEYHRRQIADRHYSVARTEILLADNSTLKTLCFDQGVLLSRHHLGVHIYGQQAFVKCLGAYMLGSNHQLSNYTHIHHGLGGSTSQQLYKGIVDRQARAVFNGRVSIDAGAQKASSEQLNANLLLSSQAEVDSKPQLEIHADDVKATHGSTVGQLQAEELFYLQSRAIAPQLAREMLALGFIQELFLDIEDSNLSKLWQEQLLHSYKRMSAHV